MRTLVVALALLTLTPALGAVPFAAGSDAAPLPIPVVVIAHIDTGINPYHVAFRDDGPLAFVHPSAYLPGFPKDAEAVWLSLDEPSYEAAVAKDADVLAGLKRDTLYWFPGTRVVGAISFGAGGTNCPLVPIPPASIVGATGCTERIVLDDHGHGTMTASRMAAAGGSLAPTARIVTIEGLGGASTRWAAEQGWIDVQTNSWGSLLVNAPRPPGTPPWLGSDMGETAANIEYAASRMLTFFASGNGLGFSGVAPQPTYGIETGPPGVVLVGAHDNGRMSLWSGSPAHVVADGYGGLRASAFSTTEFGPDPMSCCTSAASPYAAGGAAALILEARRILGDVGVGMRGDALAVGTPTERGPLADGKLTLDEAKDIVLRSAEARPGEGIHDGITHWTGAPENGPSEYVTAHGPGANPFCQGCVTTPLGWQAIPDAGASAFPLVGFGAVNERSAALARDVLLGEAALPERALESEFYALDQEMRRTIY